MPSALWENSVQLHTKLYQFVMCFMYRNFVDLQKCIFRNLNDPLIIVFFSLFIKIGRSNRNIYIFMFKHRCLLALRA